MNYVNVLAGIKLFAAVSFVCLIVLLGLIYAASAICFHIDKRRKEKLLKSYHCERYMSGVPSVGDGAFYSWKTPDYAINIDERDIKRWTYSRLKSFLESKQPEV